ncbi:hypothetical protein FB45DRAFT_155389 [Roridomyces roridus]|uniref:Uncharacterized protein n=1 Tax=Roridomyces roridus TaxID=1738132 RepID=A0AAD7FEE4_9AGAR|nr:hypothetical protein FB45DRAFT_155389 [Roridomyces roridus]
MLPPSACQRVALSAMSKSILLRGFRTSCRRRNESSFAESVERYKQARAAQKRKEPSWKPPSTFRPELLRPSDFLQELPDPFHRFHVRPRPRTALQSISDQHVGASIGWATTPPPIPCSGFLYYHSPSETSSLAGSMRFRLTPDYKPDTSPQSAFTAGSDLLIPHAGNLPWSVPIWILTGQQHFGPVPNILRADGYPIVADSMAKELRKQLSSGCLTLYALGQPFLVEFHMHTIRVAVFASYANAITLGRIQTGFVDLESKNFRSPYRGMGIMTLDRLEDGTLVTRLEKILSLQEACLNERIPAPVEGMTRELELAPILFKESTKPTHPKYQGSLLHLRRAFDALPPISKK